jgi:hypothetical protein
MPSRSLDHAGHFLLTAFVAAAQRLSKPVTLSVALACGPPAPAACIGSLSPPPAAPPPLDAVVLRCTALPSERPERPPPTSDAMCSAPENEG